MVEKTFLETANGAILERANYELNKVFDNIMDVNTPAEKVRKLTLVIEFKANSERTKISHSVSAKPSLQPTNPITGTLAVLCDTDGVLQMVEMVPQVPGQLFMDGNEQEEPTVIQFQRRA